MGVVRSDQELIAAANGGDADAFALLYQRYRDWVVALAWRFSGDRDVALDVAQETFIYVLGKFPGFVLTAQFKTFLYPVVKHLALSAKGKSLRFAGVSTGGEADEPDALQRVAGPDPVASGDETLGLDDLAAVMACLSEEHRETVLLRFVDGLSLEEIARAMAVPLGTVKSRLHHALGKLRSDERVKKYFER